MIFRFIYCVLWAKYEPVWTDFTAQTVTLGANLLVKATPYIKTPSALFLLPNLVFTKYLNFEYG